MATYVFSSHDGYGLGHVRRNVLIANEVRRQDPTARTIIVTGVEADLPWLHQAGLEVVAVPSLRKGADGRYANTAMGLERALAVRSERFEGLIDEVRPDAVLVDRHPSGIDGELRPGLDRCRQLGIATVLGLRDILDDAESVRRELAGPGWADVDQQFEDVLVYGDRVLCDHELEYGLPLQPVYTGWVTDREGLDAGLAESAARHVEESLLVIAAGGGGDGEEVARVGIDLLRRNPRWRALFVSGPHAAHAAIEADPRLADRLQVVHSPNGCRSLLSKAGASVQMAGYNTTLEALVAGLRPILVPRRAPRREQAIRAARLASLGLADVVDEQGDTAELAWLLNRPRRLAPGDLERCGLRTDGAPRAAWLLRTLAGQTAPTPRRARRSRPAAPRSTAAAVAP